MAKFLIDRQERVVGFDNFSRGTSQNIRVLENNNLFNFQALDLTDMPAYFAAIEKLHKQEQITEVWHLAANSDISAGIASPTIDLRDTFLTTFNTLEAIRRLSIPAIFFASSSAIYGDLGPENLHEDMGPLLPISNYGAMKLASEAAISAAVESHLTRACIFRFPNVVGTPATHGVILDFVRKLRATPNSLQVLGDGSQKKAYLHVDDLIDAMVYIRTHADRPLNVYNIAPPDDGVTVKFIAEQVVRRCSPSAKIFYGEEKRGWVGDVPRFRYSTTRLLSLGWKSTATSEYAIIRAIDEIASQEGAL